tara:strand:- start:301 stop:1929 length:1629 start_codon:yes stop_codon:yes gene_type:complete
MPYHHGGANGGGAYHGETPMTQAERAAQRSGKIKQSIQKSVGYNATVNTQLLSVSEATSGTASLTSDVRAIRVTNNGKVPGIASFQYQYWSDSDTMSDANNYQIQYLLLPGEMIYLPAARGVITGAGITNLGVSTTAADVKSSVLGSEINSGNLYVDSLIDSDDGTGADITGSASSTNLFMEQSDAEKMFFPGDLIQVGTEIMEVTAVGDGSDAANTNLTVIRGVRGSTAASDHADDAAIRFPMFNAYGNLPYNKYTLVQTNDAGYYKQTNMMGGLGRSTTDLSGIVPGSFCVIFYIPGYQKMTNDGNITSNTKSGLTAGGTYYLSVSLNGKTTDKITITVDSSNTRMGGANGVIQKLQTAINNLYEDESKNNYEQGATVSILNGDVCVTSHDRTNASAVSITTNSDGTSASKAAGGNEMFDTSNIMGRFPATIPAAVASRLPLETSTDPITGTSSFNDVFIKDKGDGTLFGPMGNGRIDYNTGAWSIKGPRNAEFAISVLVNSAFSGSLSPTSTTGQNSINAVYGNTTCQKDNTNFKLDLY